jgi:serine/threonine-protein kinase
VLGKRLGVYQIESLLGAGGMGRVYLARHVLLNRPCALKVLDPERAARDPDYLARFLEEGKAAAGLVHPNIITVHAIGDTEGHHFLEMEYLSGGSLTRWIARERTLNPVAATTIALRIAEGLAVAHDAGIVHRDLKPDNVMMSHDGVPKIADFGLAKTVETKAGPVVGTPKYMAPELFFSEEACPATDVYALGVSYYQMLSGRVPYDATTISDLIEQVTNEPSPDLTGILPGLADCVRSMMARRREDRPSDGTEATALLTDALRAVRDVDSLLHDAFSDAQHIEWHRDGDRWRLSLRLPSGRSQAVFVERTPSDADQPLLIIYSLCAPAEAGFYEHALRLNAAVPHGALAIRDVEGQPSFVMVDTYPLATVDIEGVRRSVTEVARRADAVEKLLTGEDRN